MSGTTEKPVVVKRIGSVDKVPLINLVALVVERENHLLVAMRAGVL